jgi:predicted acetyltransferase
MSTKITKLTIKLKTKKNIIGYINGIIDFDKSIILSLFVKEDFRNKHYGSYLLKKYIKICKNKNIKTIEVDDMSDNFNKSNNIYLQNNFNYINIGFPEMIIYLKD